ncbi:MAG: hypothetical protein LBV34_05460 [Nocardiopsaceae bacterium]|jgi:hypothetical protein|nr:hypothetical protein [Nocardiopsaceae bacterium]
MEGSASPIPLADIATIGPYFELTSLGKSEHEGWLAVRTLIDDAGRLRRMIDDVAVRLGTRQRWIAASVFYQGWAARLTSVYTASAALCGAVPDLGAGLVSFRPRHPGPVELDVAPLRPLTPAAGWRRMRADHLDPLATAIRGEVRIGEHLLRGNVGSALAGALSIVSAQRQLPLESLLSENWAHPDDLALSGRWLRTPDGPRYARLTCCGYDQLDQRGRCGDCSLNWHGGRWPVFAAAPDPPRAESRSHEP